MVFIFANSTGFEAKQSPLPAKMAIVSGGTH